MNTLKETLRAIKVLVSAKTIKGTSFVGIKGYTNSKGEVSNQTLLVGFNLVNLLKKDLEKLKQVDISSVIEKYGEQVATTAYSELLESLAKRTATEEEKETLRKYNDSTMKRSDAQIDAYISLAKGVKQHNENKDVKVYGLVVNKKVLVEGEYKPVNSRPKTLAKKDLQKLADLKQTKIRTFTFNDATNVNLQGVTC
jgi:hypothetical protein